MTVRPWFKAYHRDFLHGISRLNESEIAAYTVVLFLIYSHGGAIDDDARWISRQIGAAFSCRKWTAVRQSLLDKGKLTLTPDGKITNIRAEKELKTGGKEHETLVENGVKGGLKRAENAGVVKQDNGLAEKGLEIPPSMAEGRKQSPDSEKQACLPSLGTAEHPVERSRLPKLNDPEFKWAVLTANSGFDNAGKRHPMVRSFFLDQVCAGVCKAAGINDPGWRGDWDTVARWLHDGLLPNVILDAIEDRAAKRGYSPPTVLRYFDALVRVWAAEHPGPGSERRAA